MRERGGGGWEKERDTLRERKRKIDTLRERERFDRQTNTKIDTERKTNTETDRRIQRASERERELISNEDTYFVETVVLYNQIRSFLLLLLL